MEQRATFITLGAKDLKTAIDFYENKFGWKRSEMSNDDLINTLSSKGVQVIKQPQKVFWGGYSSYIQDPDGNLWEIAYNPYLKNDR